MWFTEIKTLIPEDSNGTLVNLTLKHIQIAPCLTLQRASQYKACRFHLSLSQALVLRPYFQLQSTFALQQKPERRYYAGENNTFSLALDSL